MSKKVYFRNLQPDPEGPIFGYVYDAAEFTKMQAFIHEHIEGVVKDLLMGGAAAAVVSGFGATPGTGLNLNVAAGQVHTTDGRTYGADAVTVALSTAHATLPRVDLVYAALASDAEAATQFRPFRQQRTLSQLQANVPPYTPVENNVSTELHTRATVLVRAGTPNASPAAPALNAGEVPLFHVAVAANAVSIISGNITSVRNVARSLAQVLSDLANINETIDDRVAVLVHAGNGIILAYDDAGNLLNVSVDEARYVRRTAGAGALQDINSPLRTSERIGANGDASTPMSTPLTAGHFRQLKRTSPLGTLRGALTISSEAFDTGLPNGDGYTGIDFIYNDTYAPGARIAVRSQQNGSQFHFGTSNQFNNGIERVVFIIDADFAGLVKANYNMQVIGNFTAGSKSFLIDHPLDADNKNLRHAAIESPQRDLVYRGRKTLLTSGGTATRTINVDTEKGMTAGTLVALCDVENAAIFVQNLSTTEGATITNNNNGTFTVSVVSGDDVDISWLYIAERIDPLVMALEDSDEDGHLIVEEEKPDPPSGPDLALLLADREESTQREDAEPDEEYEEIVYELIGVKGYPLHAQITGEGTVPKRNVTRAITDMLGNSYEEP